MKKPKLRNGSAAVFKPNFMAGLLSVIFLALTAQSCSIKNIMLDEMASVIEKGMPAFEAENDLPFLEKAFPANIKLLETLLVSRPDNGRLLTLLSRMYAGYAFAFFEGRLDRAAMARPSDPNGGSGVEYHRAALNRYYQKGAEYALLALELSYPGSRKQLSRVTAIESFMNRLTPKDLPALFWYGFNMGAYVNQNRDSMKAIAKAFPAEKAMLRVVELDETYYHGSAHLFLMINYAARPPMMGGRPEKSLYHYHRLKSVAGEHFLLGDVYFARYYLHRTQNREQFEKMLTSVVGDRAAHAHYPLLNAVAVNRAKIYLKAVDQLFD